MPTVKDTRQWPAMRARISVRLSANRLDLDPRGTAELLSSESAQPLFTLCGNLLFTILLLHQARALVPGPCLLASESEESTSPLAPGTNSKLDDDTTCVQSRDIASCKLIMQETSRKKLTCSEALATGPHCLSAAPHVLNRSSIRCWHDTLCVGNWATILLAIGMCLIGDRLACAADLSCKLSARVAQRRRRIFGSGRGRKVGLLHMALRSSHGEFNSTTP
jgi:hypothetical protein